MSHSNMHEDDKSEDEEMEEEEMEQEWYETIRYSLIVVKAIIHVLNELLVNMCRPHLQHPLIRQPKSTSGYDYIHKILNEDLVHF